MTINERLAALIEDTDTHIGHLAESIEINPRQITRWKKGEAEMGIYKLKKLCEHYGVSADYILGLPRGLYWPRG